MNSLRKQLSLLSLTLFLNSCAVSPPNVRVFVRLQKGAQSAYTIDGPQERLTEEEFKEIEVGLVCMEPKSWGEVKTFIDKVCQRDGSCDLDNIKEAEANIEKGMK